MFRYDRIRARWRTRVRESLEEEAEEVEMEWRFSHDLPKWEAGWRRKLREKQNSK